MLIRGPGADRCEVVSLEALPPDASKQHERLLAGSEPEYRDKVSESSTVGCGSLSSLRSGDVDKLSISSELDGKCRPSSHQRSRSLQHLLHCVA